MSSEHRLHPYSILFAFLTQIRLFVVPGLLLAVGMGSRGGDWWEWQPWMMLLIVPNALFALVHYLTYRYRFDEQELVIRSGLLFRRERHIPYARIQSIDAVQNVLQRLADVAEVRIETGGGDSAEATMRVLPLSAFRAMRERVFAERDVPAAAAPAADASTIASSGPSSPASRRPSTAAGRPPLLALDLRETLICGFLENRGGVVIATALGVAWEMGFIERTLAPWVGEGTMGRGAIRNLVRGAISSATVSWDRLAWVLGAVIALLLFVRLVSMCWAVVRLYGFTVTEVDDDLRRAFGLLTRVALTTPRRRIQTLTVFEGPWHRYLGRVAVRVDTAGGRAKNEDTQSDREYLAPILVRTALPAFVNAVVGVNLSDVIWNPPHPRAFRREIKPWLALAGMLSAVSVYTFGPPALAIVPVLALWAFVVARQNIKHLRWSETGDAVLLTHGWIWRRIVIVRLAKIQVVTRRESLFDRRHAMASVHVDTAGAAQGRVVSVPYLAATVADGLYVRLAAAAANTQFRW